MVKKRNSLKNSKIAYLIGLVVLLVVGLAYAYHLNHKPKPIPTVGQYTKGETNKSIGSSSPAGSSSPSSTAPSGAKVGDSGGMLVAPTGNFVSNHRPNLSGSPAPNSMTSVCNTSPSASCRITFANGSTTKALPDQTTDAGGATYWYWKLQDIGLTAGSWKITATSSLGGNSLSSTDPASLEVSP